jgi:hypothetical protein
MAKSEFVNCGEKNSDVIELKLGVEGSVDG